MLSEAIYYQEIDFENIRMVDILPQLEIVAKYNKLKLNRAVQFKIAKRMLIKSLYLN